MTDLKSEWWQEFFPGVWLEFASTQWDEEANRSQAACLEKLLRLPPGAKVLDVPCGYGRHALTLAERGYRLTGVDFLAPHLDLGKAEAGKRGLEVAWELRDMRDLPWASEFDAAFCYFTGFGYFDEAGNLAFLKAVAKSLKPGGRFLLELLTTETLLPKFQPRSWDRVGGTLVLQDRTYDPAAGRILTEWTVLKGEEEKRCSSSIRLYSYRELCELLASVGFGNFEGYDTATKGPFKLGASRLALLAELGRGA